MHSTPSPRRTLRNLVVAGLGTALVGGTFAVAAATVAPQVAGASTTPVAASWSATPSCGTYVTATPPAGTVSATVTIKGAGGGGGATNSGSGGSGGNGDGVTGTLLLDHSRGAVSVDLGCGGSGGSENGGSGTTNGGSGGGGYAAGAGGGAAKAETASVDGRASGGGGGGASALCRGTTGCTTPVVVVGGGGGGGGRFDCTGSTGPGSGGSGSATASPPTVDPGAAGSNGDGSNGAGGGGGTASGGGGGGNGYEQSGSGGANTPTSSTGGSGGTGGSTSAFSYEAGAGGGGGGGGYTGGGGGGGDACATGSDAGGGGGAGSSVVESAYNLTSSYGAGAAGGGTSTPGTAGSISLTWNVDNLSVTNPGTRASVSGTAVTGPTIAAPHDTTGGNTVSFAATGLPTGLTINPSTGSITGTPTTAGNYSVTVTATDSEALSASTSFGWTVTNTVTVSGPGNQSSVSGTPVTPLTDSASDSSSTATISSWSATGLPPGVTVNAANGVITGTPTTAGTYTVTVGATDSAGQTGSTSFTWTVTNTVTVAAPGPESSVSGSAVSAVTVGATDSSSTATISSYAATGLPTGLTINSSTGTVTGTPTTAGTYPVTVTATDSASFAGTTSFTWTVTNTVGITSPGNQTSVSGTAITPLSTPATDTSSTTGLTWSATGLPAGLSLDASTGSVTGTPTTAGVDAVTVTVTDGSGYSAQTTFTWTVTNVVAITSPGGQSSVSGSPIDPLVVGATDTSSTATLGYTASGLPGGLSIDPTTGTISGSPTVAGSFSVTVTASDDAGYSASTTFEWSVTNTVTMTDPGNQSDVSGTPIAVVAVPTVDSVTDATLTFGDNGTLPAGLSIDPATGDITGTPTGAGTSVVTITATDNYGYAAQVTFTWVVTNTVTVVGPGNQSGISGTAIAPFVVPATDSSATASLAYAATGLPAGISVDAGSGTVSGTPTTAGSTTVTVTVTDSSGFAGTATFTWTVTNVVSASGPGPQSDVSGSVVTPVTVSASDSSPTTSLVFAAGGSLPAGLSINPTSGQITGTPTTGGSYPVTITVTDGSGFHTSVAFTWVVINTVTVTGPTTETTQVGVTIVPVVLTGTDSSTTTHLTWSATGLPSGLTIAPTTGSITGSTLHSGAYAVTVTATDSAGFHGSASFTWYAVGASITGVKPASGPGAGGTKVSITGSDFVGTTSVTFGSVPAASFVVNKRGTKITAYAPSEPAGTVNIVVTTGTGPSLVTPADTYVFTGPVVTSLSVTAGHTTGGTKVVITGTGFNGATTVRFGAIPASSFTINKAGTKITAYSPPESAGTVDVTVTTPGGTSPLSAGDHFTFS